MEDRFLALPSVHRADLEGRLRVDFTCSSNPPAMSAFCAFLPYRAPSGKVALGRFGLFAAQLGKDPYLRIPAGWNRRQADIPNHNGGYPGPLDR
jgi:hypothetical protein